MPTGVLRGFLAYIPKRALEKYGLHSARYVADILALMVRINGVLSTGLVLISCCRSNVCFRLANLLPGAISRDAVV